MSEMQKNNLPDDDFIIGKGFEVEEIEIEQKPKRKEKKSKELKFM